MNFNELISLIKKEPETAEKTYTASFIALIQEVLSKESPGGAVHSTESLQAAFGPEINDLFVIAENAAADKTGMKMPILKDVFDKAQEVLKNRIIVKAVPPATRATAAGGAGASSSEGAAEEVDAWPEKATSYEVLGLTPGASDADIKKAYRALSRQYHPDKTRHKGTRNITRVNAAYETLMDPGKHTCSAPAAVGSKLPGDDKVKQDFVHGYAPLTADRAKVSPSVIDLLRTKLVKPDVVKVGNKGFRQAELDIQDEFIRRFGRLLGGLIESFDDLLFALEHFTPDARSRIIDSIGGADRLRTLLSEFVPASLLEPPLPALDDKGGVAIKYLTNDAGVSERRGLASVSSPAAGGAGGELVTASSATGMVSTSFGKGEDGDDIAIIRAKILRFINLFGGNGVSLLVKSAPALLPAIIPNIEVFLRSLATISGLERRVFVNAVSYRLSEFLAQAEYLWQVRIILKCLSQMQLSKILTVFDGLFPALIETPTEFIFLIKELHPDQQLAFLTHYRAKLPMLMAQMVTAHEWLEFLGILYPSSYEDMFELRGRSAPTATSTTTIIVAESPSEALSTSIATVGLPYMVAACKAASELKTLLESLPSDRLPYIFKMLLRHGSMKDTLAFVAKNVSDPKAQKVFYYGWLRAYADKCSRISEPTGWLSVFAAFSPRRSLAAANVLAELILAGAKADDVQTSLIKQDPEIKELYAAYLNTLEPAPGSMFLRLDNKL